MQSRPDSPPKHVFVKFVSSTYGEDPHNLLAGAKYAPSLIWCGPVVGNRRMAIVEALIRARFPACQSERDIALVERDIIAAKNLLHANNYVHGDLRVPNMLISGRRAYLIDFDWSGEIGKARYPRDLNKDVTWPLPADLLRRSYISKTDDEVRLQQSLKELKEPVKRILESTVGQDDRPVKRPRLERLFASQP